jgi:formylglycine-generating enzyme required for sulfatase activity
MNKKFVLLTVFTLMISLQLSKANNLTISNVGTQVIADLTYVTFNLSWENSWRVSYAPANYDAAWIFLKQGPNAQNVWLHGNVVLPGGFSSTVAEDKTGLFIYRSQPGFGTVNILVKIALPPTMIAYTNLHVLGLEMVYIPEGPFRVGATSVYNSSNNYWSTPSQYQVTGDATTVVMGTGAGQLNDPLGNGPFNAGFPTGFNDFYVMKYELTVEAYRDFLNLTGMFGMSLVPFNGAPVNTAATPGPRPLKLKSFTPASPGVPQKFVFGCNDDNDLIFDESNDGLGVAVIVQPNWVRNYLMWANLRPMTELEYEKACGGGSFAMANGTLQISAGFLSDKGTEQETWNFTASPPQVISYSNCAETGLFFPVRSSAASLSNHSITYAKFATGGSIYGVMDLSGNASEPCITTSDALSRNFNGTLYSGYTIKCRGGSYAEPLNVAGISRRDGNNTSYCGIRGAR